jgi:uncharacterized membrane protein
MLLLALVLLAPSYLIWSPVSAAEKADHPVNLYLYRNPYRLETIEPTFSGDAIPGSMTPGQSISYNLSYPLTDDMFMTTPLDGGVRYIIVHLQDSNVRPGVSGLKLNVQINAGRTGSTPVQIASTEFEQAEMVDDDLKVPMISTDGYELGARSVLELKLTLTGTGIVPTFFYTHLGTSGSSHISFLADPIPDDGVGLRMLGPGGFELEAIVPNGPVEVRTVDFICSVKDAFGAYDVANVTLVVRSAEGNVLFSNSTDDPRPSGGEAVAYYNVTHIFPEGTPMGIYDVIVTGNSNTGQSVSYTGKLEVRSGLFISLESSLMEAGSGDTVTFRMKVLNGGSSVDRVSFTGASDKGWTVTSPDPLELQGGEETIVEFRAIVPIRAVLRSQSNITMGASSRNADRTYTEVGKVTVTGVSTFGAEVITSPSRDTFAGQQVDFDIKVVNLLDETRSFELSPEDLPSSWTVSYTGSNGSSQGSSLYTFDIGPQLEAVVRLSATPSAQTSGRTEFRAYVMAQGETEKRYLYLSVTVVDPTRDLVKLLGESTRTAARKGTTFPVEFNRVFFASELYNPTLEPINIDADISPVEGWTASLDFGSIELAPGSGATLNVSIAPPKGALYKGGAPYAFTLTADAGGKGEASLVLNVLVPAVHKVELLPEKEVVDVKEGTSTKLNLTVRNRGNTDGKVELVATADKSLTVDLDPSSADMVSGQELIFRMEVGIGSIDEAKVYSVTVEYTFQGKKESVQVTVSGQPEKENGPIPWVTVIIIVVVVLAVLGAVIFVILIARKRTGKRPVKEAKGPAPQVTVQAVNEEPVVKKVPQTEKVGSPATFEAVDVVEPPSNVQTTATSPGDEEQIADSVMNEILGGEPPLEVTEVVEAELLE